LCAVVLGVVLCDDCPAEDPKMKSKATKPKTAAEVTFTSTLGGDCMVYWLDKKGVEKKLADLPDGQQYAASSFVGHAWRVRDTEGLLLVQHKVTADEEVAVEACDPDEADVAYDEMLGEILGDEEDVDLRPNKMKKVTPKNTDL